MTRRRSVALCLLISCAAATRLCSRQKNSPRIVPSNKRVRPRVHGQQRLGDRLIIKENKMASCKVEKFSNCHRPRLTPELHWNCQPEQAVREAPAPAWRSEQPEPGLQVESQLRELSPLAPVKQRKSLERLGGYAQTQL